LYYGKREELPKKIPFKAGELDLVYENGFLRYIKLGDHEVLRMINYAVRDHNWNTIPLEIINEHIEVKPDSFHIRYQSEARQGNILFAWECTIEGTKDSSLNFKIRGTSRSTFKRNRIGFTVLHPITECAGKSVSILHDNGNIEKSMFPSMISPHQPFFDVKAMTWELPNGNAVLEFFREVFETEDQRNWIDDSYKTYCTPLSLPFPVDVHPGDKVEQQIKLTVNNIISIPVQKKARYLSVDRNFIELPKIGIGRSSEVNILSKDEVELFKSVPFDHYQVDVKLYDSWQEDFRKAIEESSKLNYPLETSLFFDNLQEELDEFIRFVQLEKPNITIINVFNKNPYSTQKETIDKVVATLKSVFPSTKIGGGTNAFFTELNRNRTPPEQLDFLVYSVNPQVHAFDNDSLLETINALPYTIKTATSFSKGKPVHVAPITFKMRWNPNATGESIALPEQLPPDVDVRQMSLFGAGWLLGTLNSLIASGAAALTFFETVGSKGIVQSSIPKYSQQFHAESRAIYPMFFLFQFLMQNKNLKFYPTVSSEPLQFGGLVLGDEGFGEFHMMIGNFTSEEISINIDFPVKALFITTIDEDNVEMAMQDGDFLKHINYRKAEKTAETITFLIKPYGLLFGKGNS
jgi:D-apionolactonase